MKQGIIIYRGKRLPSGNTSVKKETYPPTIITELSIGPSIKLINHSPTGFNWGYGGSGPAQLALAILLNFTGDKEKALAHYQDFKWDFVARWSGSDWCITGGQINDWLNKQAAGAVAG